MEFDKSKDTKRNLCNSCKHSFAECSATTDDIVFGDGVGNDNVWECAKYENKVEIPTVDPWHYPSKGELPTESGNYLTACKTDSGLLARFIKLYDAKFKKWESHIEVYAWCELPDLPKELKNDRK